MRKKQSENKWMKLWLSPTLAPRTQNWADFFSKVKTLDGARGAKDANFGRRAAQKQLPTTPHGAAYPHTHIHTTARALHSPRSTHTLLVYRAGGRQAAVKNSFAKFTSIFYRRWRPGHKLNFFTKPVPCILHKFGELCRPPGISAASSYSSGERKSKMRERPPKIGRPLTNRQSAVLILHADFF